MKRYLISPLLLISLLLFSSSVFANGADIGDLLNGVAKHPDIAASALTMRASDVRLQQAHAQLYPSVTGFGSYTLYNSPTNLRPMPPTENDIAAGDSLPFSKQIIRYGLKLQMPLFNKSLFSLADKIKHLQKASRAGHKLHLITRQAQVVALDAQLAFNEHLAAALTARIESLQKTCADLLVGVNNGRTPQIELLKVENSRNELQKQAIDLQRQHITLISQLQQLTGISLDNAVSLTLQHPIVAGNFIRQIQQQANTQAQQKELQQAWDKHYPTLKLEAVATGNDGDAYNTDDSIQRNYDYVGVTLSLPLFDRSISTSIDQAAVQLHRQQKRLAQLRIELSSQAQSLNEQLPVIQQSRQLADTSLSNSQQLLKVAKVAYSSGRMTTEEYLRFEAALLNSAAAVYKTDVDRWQIICQQAVLYGTDLTGVVK